MAVKNIVHDGIRFILADHTFSKKAGGILLPLLLTINAKSRSLGVQKNGALDFQFNWYTGPTILFWRGFLRSLSPGEHQIIIKRLI